MISWIDKSGAFIPRVLPHKFLIINNDEQREILKKTNAYFIRWHEGFDTEKTNFWYVIKDTFGGLEELSSSTRSKVRRSFHHCYLRKIKKEELKTLGYKVYLAACQNYRTFEKTMSEETFGKRIDSLDENEYDFWGVFKENDDILVGYSENYIKENVAFYEELYFHPQYQKYYTSYALFYKMNEYYLQDRKFLYVHDGSRNLVHQTQIHMFLIEKFKFRKAYCTMKLYYRRDIKVLVFVLFPFRKIIYSLNSSFFQKISALLRHEEISRGLE